MRCSLVVFSVKIVILVLIFDVCVNAKAGFYTDNGHGQTEINMIMSEEEKHEMELTVLHLLGMSSRPKKIKEETVRKSASKYLIDVYKALVEEEIDAEESVSRVRRSADINLSGEEQEQIDRSDIIMTFESVNHHVPGVRHERGKRLWFNVSEVPVAEDVVGAELRIYQNPIYSNGTDDVFTVTAYQLVKTDNGEKELEYVSEVNTTKSATGWLSLNVTVCLATWVAFPELNKGFYLSVHPAGKQAHEVRPEDIGLITVKSLEETQPFMVAFLKTANRVKARPTREAKSRVKKSDVSNLFRSIYRNVEQDPWRSCQMHTLYISFKDLKWTDWVIAPEGYPAYYCHGECNFPLNAHMNASNHAIVQTLVHLMQPFRYPKSCCAPTKLGVINVLYFFDDTNVVLRKFKQMVVKSCGCR